MEGKHLTFVMDNAAIHKIKEVDDYFEGLSHDHNVHYIPPYSPQLNPIELCFSTWKHYIYQFDKPNIDKAYKIIDVCSKEITATQCKNWMTHVRKYYLNCIQKIPLD